LLAASQTLLRHHEPLRSHMRLTLASQAPLGHHEPPRPHVDSMELVANDFRAAQPEDTNLPYGIRGKEAANTTHS
jgi:hypothetical protein